MRACLGNHRAWRFSRKAARAKQLWNATYLPPTLWPRMSTCLTMGSFPCRAFFVGSLLLFHSLSHMLRPILITLHLVINCSWPPHVASFLPSPWFENWFHPPDYMIWSTLSARQAIISTQPVPLVPFPSRHLISSLLAKCVSFELDIYIYSLSTGIGKDVPTDVLVPTIPHRYYNHCFLTCTNWKCAQLPLSTQLSN